VGSDPRGTYAVSTYNGPDPNASLFSVQLLFPPSAPCSLLLIMIIFGLDLRAIKPSAFKSKNMFDKRYRYRRERFVYYQLAMILLVVGEILATITLTKYLKLQTSVQQFQSGASYFNNDIVGVASLTIFAGVYSAIVFGTMFFFLLFWPALPESIIWSRIKAVAALFSLITVSAAVLASTIVGAAHHAHLIPSPTGSFEELATHFAHPTPPYRYRDYGLVIGWLVLSWIGWVFTVISTIYVFKASSFHLANPDVVKSYLLQNDEATVRSTTKMA